MGSDDNEHNSGLGRGLSALLNDIQENAKTVDSDGELESLRERIDSLELLVEEFGQARELQNELRDYVRDLKEEVADIRNYRFWVTMFAAIMSVSLFGLLIGCMVIRPDWFIALQGNLQVYLIVALGGGSTLLMTLMLRGVYRSRHERNHGEMLPEAVRIALETMRNN